MSRPILLTILLAASCGLAAPLPAVAGHTVEAGQTLALKEDLVLAGDDFLEIKGTSDRRCVLMPRSAKNRRVAA